MSRSQLHTARIVVVRDVNPLKPDFSKIKSDRIFSLAKLLQTGLKRVFFVASKNKNLVNYRRQVW
jgi:hypothetical protein